MAWSPGATRMSATPEHHQPAASRILRPGMRSLPAGTERYRVPGGGSLVVPVSAGDRLTLRDIEGGQRCELAFCADDGRFDASALGAAADTSGDGLRRTLADRRGDAGVSGTG